MKDCLFCPTPSADEHSGMLIALVASAALAVASSLTPAPVAAGEIIVAPAPSSSKTAQGAREARQRAVVEGYRNSDGDLPLQQPSTVIILDGVPSPTGSPAANSAAYNRARANQSRHKSEDLPAGQVPTQVPVLLPGQVPGQVILGTGVETIRSQQSPEVRSADDNRQRANVYRHRKKED